MKIEPLKKISSDAYNPISNQNLNNNETKESKKLFDNVEWVELADIVVHNLNNNENKESKALFGDIKGPEYGQVNIDVTDDDNVEELTDILVDGYKKLEDKVAEDKNKPTEVNNRSLSAKLEKKIGIYATEQELTTAGVIIEVLEYLLSDSWVPRLAQMLNSLSLKDWLICLTQYLLVDKRGINQPFILSNQDALRLARIREWLKSGTWTRNTVLPFTAESMLKRIFAIHHFYDIAEKIITYFWSFLLTSLFLGPELYYYHLYPDERENTWPDILFSRTPDKIALINSLAQPRHWPALTTFLVLPFLTGLASALNVSRDNKTNPLDIQQLLIDLRKYQPGWRHDFLYFLPIFSSFSGVSTTLNTIRRALLWDLRLDPSEREELSREFLKFIDKSSGLAQSSALKMSNDFATGIALRDISKLISAGVNKEQVLSILALKIKATAKIQSLSHYQLENGKKSLWRYLVANYYNLGKSEAHSLWLQPLFWLYKASQLYVQASFLAITALGLAKAYQYFQDEAACLKQDRIWSFINIINDYNCTVCADLPAVYYYNSFTLQDCLNDYLRSPRTPEQIIALISRARPDDVVEAGDFSSQSLSDQNNTSSLSLILPRVNQYLPKLKQLLLGISFGLNANFQPINIPNQLGNIGAQAVANFLNSSSHLISLNLNMLHIDERALSILAPALSHHPSLENLFMEGNNFSTRLGMQALSKVAQAPELKLLDLTSNNLHQVLQYFAPALLRSQLQILRVWGCGLDDNDMINYFASALPLSLLELSLQMNQFGSAGVQALANRLPELQLKSLELALNAIDDAGLLSLAAVVPHVSVEKYILTSINATDIGLKAYLSAAQQATAKIQKLYITSPYFSDEGFVKLKKLLTNNTILEIVVGGNITDKLVVLLSPVIGSTLQSFAIEGKRITDKTLETIATVLSNSTNLNVLVLVNTSITADGLQKYLSPVLSGSNLQIIDILDTYLNDPTNMTIFFQSLSTAKQLNTLNIINCNIDDNTLKQLTITLPKAKQLRQLALVGNNITARGFKMLADVLTKPARHEHFLWLNALDPQHRIVQKIPTPNTGLTSLFLADNNYNDSTAVQPICEALPSTNIPLANFDLGPENCIVSGATALKPALPLQIFSRLLQWAMWPISFTYQQMCSLEKHKSPAVQIEVIDDRNNIILSDDITTVEDTLISDEILRDSSDLLTAINDSSNSGTQDTIALSPGQHSTNTVGLSLTTATRRPILESAQTITLPAIITDATSTSFPLLGILSTLSVAATGLWLLHQWCSKQTNYLAPVSSATRHLYRFFHCKKPPNQLHHNSSRLPATILGTTNASEDKRELTVPKELISSSSNTENLVYVHGF